MYWHAASGLRARSVLMFHKRLIKMTQVMIDETNKRMATKRVTASPAIHKFIKPNGLFIALVL